MVPKLQRTAPQYPGKLFRAQREVGTCSPVRETLDLSRMLVGREAPLHSEYRRFCYNLTHAFLKNL